MRRGGRSARQAAMLSCAALFAASAVPMALAQQKPQRASPESAPRHQQLQQQKPQPPPASPSQEQKPPQAQPAERQQPAQPSALSPLNSVRTAPELIGQVPGHFFWIREGLQCVQDPVDGQLVFLNDEGKVVGRATPPPNFTIGEIVSEPDQIRLLDSNRRQVTIARTVGSSAETAVAKGAMPVRWRSATTRNTRSSLMVGAPSAKA